MKKDAKKKTLKCQDCGKKNETVSATICPYAEEINDAKVSIVVCEDCYGERAADI